MQQTSTQHSWKRRRRSKGMTAAVPLFASLLLITLSLSVKSAHAFLGLPTKRFRYEGLIDAGALGLDNIEGHVVAFGDWNADSAVDLFTLSSDARTINVHLWDHASFTFTPLPEAQIVAPSSYVFVNVVPGDFNYDGKLDVLGMMKKQGEANGDTEMVIWLGLPDGSVSSSSSQITLDSASNVQPFVVDATGNLRADLIGHTAAKSDTLSVWKNVMSRHNTTRAFDVQDAPLFSPDSANAQASVPTCKLSDPHSSAFVDLNGDCLADLFLVCQDSGWTGSSSLSYQIWTANKDTRKPGYTLARHGNLPSGTGPLSFADMDRDGTIDVVFASCDGSTGPCYINIAYNRQMPLCSEKRNDWFGVGPGGAMLSNETLKCRDTESNLCTADDSFLFDFDVSPKNDKLTRIPLLDITPESQILLSDKYVSPSALPVSLALGDYNRDGYPDLVVITVPHATQQHDETRVRMLESVTCDVRGTPLAGCPADPALRARHRTFKWRTDAVEAIDMITDARSVSFFDLDEDGSLDLLIQRLPNASSVAASASKAFMNRRRVTFVQNNFFYDAFFLKAMTSNGACGSYCDANSAGGDSGSSEFAAHKARYRPWGVNYNGASYKFTVLDTSGIRRPQQVGQLAQTAYRSMLLPYAYFGLGRTNNYVESLFVGVTRRRVTNFVEMEGVIPNSQVVILPWEPSNNIDNEDQSGDDGRSNDDKKGDTSTWQRELYLSPGEWIPWVTVVLATIVVMLLGVVFVLHLHEKREDERERKRAVHAINFDAL